MENETGNIERYGNVLENIHDGCFELDLAGNFTFFNDSVCRVLGYPREELMGMNYRHYTDKENVNKVFRAFHKVYKTEEPLQEYVWQITRKDGAKRHIEGSLSLKKDSSEKSTGFRVIARDITKRKQAEETLKESENKYRLSFENVSDVIFMIDTDLKISSISPSVARILGYKPQDFIGRSVYDIGNIILTPESFKPAVANTSLILKGETLPTGIYEFIARDGTIKFCELSGSPIIQKGKIIGMISVARDITEHKRAAEALKQSESWYRTIFENTGTAVIIIEEDTTISLTNAEFEKLSGYSKKEIEGRKHWEEFVVQEDLERMLTQHRLRREDAKSAQKKYEFRFVDKDSAIKDIVLSTDMIPGTKKSIASLLDITERKRAEEELQLTLQSLIKSVGTTIQVMVSAVEMRDPYTAGHQKRCAEIARAIATEMGLPQEEIDGIVMAGIIHDIGKLSVPSEILSKPTTLTNIEFSLIKEHSRIGYEILKAVESPWPLAEIIYQHHELMNGTGYPRNLKGDEIILEARILAVADIVEAMASHRPYRAALGIEAALGEIEKNKGILYDASVADTCLRLFREKGYQLT